MSDLAGSQRPARRRRILDVNTQSAAQAAGVDDGAIGAHGRLITLDEGIYALSVPAAAPRGEAGGVKFPVVQVSAPPSDDYDLVEIVTGSGDLPEWCDTAGGVVVVKAPAGGGVVLVTTFGPMVGNEPSEVEIRRLGSGAALPAAAAAPKPAPVPHPASAPAEPRSELVLHIEREGDRRFEAAGWAGTRGQRRRVEAFSVRPLETLTPGDVEYKAFGPNGRETPWV